MSEAHLLYIGCAVTNGDEGSTIIAFFNVYGGNWHPSTLPLPSSRVLGISAFFHTDQKLASPSIRGSGNKTDDKHMFRLFRKFSFRQPD